MGHKKRVCRKLFWDGTWFYSLAFVSKAGISFSASAWILPRLEVAMQPSRLHLTCRVNVPIEFGNLHFLIEILLIDKGR